MKVGISFLFIFILIVKLFSLEAILIDFNNLENTTIDFSRFAKGVYLNDELKQEMMVDLNPDRWTVKVNSSSATMKAIEKSYVFPVKNSQTYPDKVVLGVRIFFPERHANSYAIIEPPFEIPIYYDTLEKLTGKGDAFLYKGVVRNVGVLRKLSVLALGSNFRYTLYVRVKDHKGEEKDIFVGFLDYQGWKTKTWLNPNLDFDLAMREYDKRRRPHYPDEYPHLKLVNIMIQRSDPEVTGNFVTLIKEISVEYDEAIIPTGMAEDNLEEIFGIYQEELVERVKAEMNNIDKQIYLKWEEKKKMHKEEEQSEPTTVHE